MNVTNNSTECTRTHHNRSIVCVIAYLYWASSETNLYIQFFSVGGVTSFNNDDVFSTDSPLLYSSGQVLHLQFFLTVPPLRSCGELRRKKGLAHLTQSAVESQTHQNIWYQYGAGRSKAFACGGDKRLFLKDPSRLYTYIGIRGYQMPVVWEKERYITKIRLIVIWGKKSSRTRIYHPK